MKKTLLALALVATSFAAAAQVTGTVKYDYDRAEDSAVYGAGHRVTTSLAYGFGSFGAVDAGYVAGQLVVGGNRVNGNGFDIGYSNGVKLGNVGVNARIGYSELRSGRVQGFGSGTLARTSVAVEGTLPVTKSVTAVAGYEYNDVRIRAGGALLGEGHGDRFTVGADLAVSKNLSVRALYARSRALGQDANGLTTAVSYKF